MGAWSFVEPNIEWVLQHTPIANTRGRATSAGRRRRRRRRASPASTTRSRRRWSSRRSPAEVVRTDDDRDQGAGARRIRDRGDGRPVVQEARRGGQGRRAAGRARDRQGDGGGAGAGRRRARRHQGGAGRHRRASARCWARSRKVPPRRARIEAAAPQPAPPAAKPTPPPASAKPARQHAAAAPRQRRHAAGARRAQDDGGEGDRRRRRAGLRPARPGAQGGCDRRRRRQARGTGCRAAPPRPPRLRADGDARRCPCTQMRAPVGRQRCRARGARAHDAPAPDHRPAPQGRAEHGRHAHHVQRRGHERHHEAAGASTRTCSRSATA